jgi:hypothetical protein
MSDIYHCQKVPQASIVRSQGEFANFPSVVVIFVLARHYTSNLPLLQISINSPDTSSHPDHCIQQSPSPSEWLSPTRRPIKMSKSDNPVDTAHFNCTSCEQIILYDGQISVQCLDSQGYHRSRCVNYLLMDMDDYCVEVNTVLLP